MLKLQSLLLLLKKKKYTLRESIFLNNRKIIQCDEFKSHLKLFFFCVNDLRTRAASKHDRKNACLLGKDCQRK